MESTSMIWDNLNQCIRNECLMLKIVREKKRVNLPIRMHDRIIDRVTISKELKWKKMSLTLTCACH